MTKAELIVSIVGIIHKKLCWFQFPQKQSKN